MFFWNIRVSMQFLWHEMIEHIFSVVYTDYYVHISNIICLRVCMYMCVSVQSVSTSVRLLELKLEE